VQLGVCLLNKGDPEFLRVWTVPIERSFCGNIVWDTSVNLYKIPATIFEKLENSETVFDSIMNNQVFK
jgi:hypothetical protein